MRVLLVNINRERLPDPLAPIGLAYVAGAVVEAGHDVLVADLCFADDPQALLKERILKHDPEVIGIGMRNVDNTAFPNTESYLPFAKECVATIRANTKAPIVMGGSGFSLLPSHFLKRLEVEMGCVGEGEESFPKLLDAINKGDDPAQVPGVMVRHGDKILHTPAEPIWRPAPAPMSGWPLFDVAQYWAEGGHINIQTKRGCNFRCTYCTYPLLEGRSVRAREPGEVVDELERWRKDYGINHFFFVDNVFNNPLEQATEILEEIIARKLRIGWTAYMTPRFANVEFCKLAVRSGCSGVELGIDGGSDVTMRSMHKGFLSDDVRTFFSYADEAKLRVCCSLIFGAPGENRQTIDETFALMDEVKPNAVIALVGVRVYPGSPIYPHAVEVGQVDPDDDPIDPAFYLSAEMTDDDIRSIYAGAEERPNWIMPGHSIRMDEDLFKRLRKKNLKGPLWRLMKAREVNPQVLPTGV